MQNRFILFRRGRIFYCEDSSTGKQTSLRTRCEDQARKLIQAKNEAVRQPLMNLTLAAHDPKLITRTWADVMERFRQRDCDATRTRPAW